jgi:hypothetical protein
VDTMPAEDFEFVSQLGHGSYATVYKVRMCLHP